MAPSRNKTAGRVLKTPTVSFDSEQESTSQEAVPQPALPFPVVCVGASAGGLEAFTQLLNAVPTDTGIRSRLAPVAIARQPPGGDPVPRDADACK